MHMHISIWIESSRSITSSRSRERAPNPSQGQEGLLASSSVMTSHTVLAAGQVWLGAAVVVPWLAAGESEIGGAECQRSCGGVDIPFPFGMGPYHCRLLGFEISCKDTGNGVLKPLMVTKPKDAILEVLNISLEQGEVKVLHPISSYCYDAASGMMVASQWSWRLTNYSFSSTANKFTVVGCRSCALAARCP